MLITEYTYAMHVKKSNSPTEYFLVMISSLLKSGSDIELPTDGEQYYDQYDEALAEDAHVERVAFLSLIDMSAHTLNSNDANRCEQRLNPEEDAATRRACGDRLGHERFVDRESGCG